MILWPTPENYDRFRAVCVDPTPPTYEEYEASGPAPAAGDERLSFDPDALQRWCETHGYKVDAYGRGLYAAVLSLFA